MPLQELKIKIGADVSEAVKGVKKLSLTVEDLRASILAKKEFIIRETDINKIIKYNKEIESLQSVLNQVQNAGKDGFWGGKPLAEMETSTKIAKRGLDALKSSFMDALGPIQKAYSGIRILANILPGVGVAGLIGFAVEPIIDFAKGLFGVDEAAQKAGTGIKIFRDALGDAAAEIASSGVANLTKLSAALTDTVLPINQRKAALDEYNKVADKQNQIALTDLNNIHRINEAIGNQISLLKTRALIKGAEDQIAGLFKTVFANEFRISNAADKFKKQFDLSQLTNEAGNVKAFTNEIGKLQDATQTLGTQQVIFSDKEIAAAQRKIGDLFGFIQRTAEQGSIFGTVFDVTADKTKAEKAAKKIKKEVEKFHFAFPIEPTIHNAPALAKEVGKAFSELHVKPALQVDEASDSIKKLTLDTIDSFDKIRVAGDSLGKGLGAVFQDIFSRKLESAVAEGLNPEQLEAFQKKLRETIIVGAELADVLGTAFGAFGSALVQGQNALQAFFNSVKQSLSQLVGQLFKTIAVAAILSVITGGAGTGGLSFLGAFKSLLSVKPFAEGGLVSGPTTALIGEGRMTNRSNPEVVAPLDKLKKYLGGGQQQLAFIANTKISWDGLDIAFQRMQEHKRRTQ